MLTTRTVFLKVVGVTPDKLQKLHAFADFRNPASCSPYRVSGTSREVHSFDHGVPCVTVLASKYEDTEGAYRVEVRVLTAVRAQKYIDIRTIGTSEGGENGVLHESEQDFWLITPSNILDTLLKILDLLPVKESVVEETP